MAHHLTSNRTVIDPVLTVAETSSSRVPLNFYEFFFHRISISNRSRIFFRGFLFLENNETRRGFWRNNYRLYFYIIGGGGGVRYREMGRIIFRY